MIQVEVTQEDLIQLVQWNTKCRKALIRAFAHIKDKLVAVPQFNQETGCCLLEAWSWHTRTTGYNSHLICT